MLDSTRQLTLRRVGPALSTITLDMVGYRQGSKAPPLSQKSFVVKRRRLFSGEEGRGKGGVCTHGMHRRSRMTTQVDSRTPIMPGQGMHEVDFAIEQKSNNLPRTC